MIERGRIHPGGSGHSRVSSALCLGAVVVRVLVVGHPASSDDDIDSILTGLVQHLTLAFALVDWSPVVPGYFPGLRVLLAIP